jgi:uncharacterized protein (UPF0264 family)
MLVSVRTRTEARLAFLGGARLIDVKEPQEGPLGRASDDVIRDVIDEVAGRCPVSAAFGEFVESLPLFSGPGLAFGKWGLADLRNHSGWRAELSLAGRRLLRSAPGCRPVAVAYADWIQAQSPHPTEILAFAKMEKWPAVLIDTWKKDGHHLLDWVACDELVSWVKRCRNYGLRLALAGSLDQALMKRLRYLKPDWFAVRGMVCTGNDRAGRLVKNRVRRIVDFLAAPVAAATSGN